MYIYIYMYMILNMVYGGFLKWGHISQEWMGYKGKAIYQWMRQVELT